MPAKPDRPFTERVLTLGPRLRRRVGMSTVGSLVAFAVMGGLGEPMTLANRGALLVICFVYGGAMGLVAPAVMPGWLVRLGKRSRPHWVLARIVALPLIIAAGGLIAAAILIPTGLLPARLGLRLIVPYLYGGPAVAAVATIFFAVIFYESLRSRIETARIALRTKERDEAEARRIAAEAQLASLESRVQPHFLFNTLNSIAALIPQDPVGAERMTGRLASLLRSSLDTASTPLVPLEHELKIVRDYLEIERVRFGDRLRYQIDVDQGTGDLTIPRLSLQTLVENSVKYAVSPSRTGATIWVRIRVGHEVLHLEVEDDGPGFRAASELPGHGLALLRERLQMTYGSTATFTIDDQHGHTVVRIQIPIAAHRPSIS